MLTVSTLPMTWEHPVFITQINRKTLEGPIKVYPGDSVDLQGVIGEIVTDVTWLE